MNCIVCVDQNFGIGKNNQLLFHIPEDLEFFKKKTTGKVIVMGKNTFLSLPNKEPLPNRTNIILSKTLKQNNLLVCKNISELFNELKNYNSNDIFIIGGETVYNQLLLYCDTAFITKIKATTEADSYFPNIDKMPQWTLKSKSCEKTYNNFIYSFYEYENKSTSPLNEI